MEWSNQQKSALDAIFHWQRKNSTQVFRLFGHAGTGKTTLAKEIADMISGTVLFAAFTGKATSVLASKGCTPASTIHSLIYTTKEKGKAILIEMEENLENLIKELQEEGKSDKEIKNEKGVINLKNKIKLETKALSEPFFIINHDSIIQDADLVIIDECSMVNDRMGEDLLSFKVPILVIGDPAQLPPVKGSGYFTNGKSDILLTEIHRQAVDNPIIRLATMVREGQEIPYGEYGSSSVIKKTPGFEVLKTYDQILCGRNNTRHAINTFYRNQLGFTSDFPEENDILVCGRNNWDLGILNGLIYKVLKVSNHMGRKIFLRLEAEDGAIVEVSTHEQYFIGKADEIQWFEEREAEKFEFGYALTTHKAQGSQWGRVLIKDESSIFRGDSRKWLYTAITRAVKDVTIVR